jgi:hypothetical protein
MSETNKSDEIRATFQVLGLEAKNKEVIDYLKERGIDVVPSQVSNIRFELNNKDKLNDNGVSVKDLLLIKEMINKFGSIEKLKQVITVYDELIS